MAASKPTFFTLLKDALGDRVDPAATSFLELMSEDFVMEFPYARPGMQRRIEGLSNVAAYLMTVAQGVRIDAVEPIAVHETGDPEVVIVEFQAHGRALKVDEPYLQRYISVIRTRGGKMIAYKDYWDPLQGLKAQKGSAAVEAFVLGTAPAQEDAA